MKRPICDCTQMLNFVQVNVPLFPTAILPMSSWTEGSSLEQMPPILTIGEATWPCSPYDSQQVIVEPQICY